MYTPPGFKIHGVPFVCGFAIFGAFFLIASLGQEAVLRFFIVLICISFLYLLYGVHAAEAHDTDVDAARACVRTATHVLVGSHRRSGTWWIIGWSQWMTLDWFVEARDTQTCMPAVTRSWQHPILGPWRARRRRLNDSVDAVYAWVLLQAPAMKCGTSDVLRTSLRKKASVHLLHCL